MVFLIVIVFASVPLLSAFAYTTAAGIALAGSFIGRIHSRLIQLAAAVGALTVVAVTAWMLASFILPCLPDFRTTGDGGVGMAYNLVCKMATWLMSPAVTCLLTGLILHAIGKNRSRPEKV